MIDEFDAPPVLSRPESYGRKSPPAWLLEAARKAGKTWNELTSTFEPATSQPGA